MLKLREIEADFLKFFGRKKRINVEYLLSKNYSLFNLFTLVTLRNDLKEIIINLPIDNDVIETKVDKRTIRILNYTFERRC